MKYLLDTHAWIQRAAGENIPEAARRIMEREPREFSLADISLWEAGKLFELGRIEIDTSVEDFLTMPLLPTWQCFRSLRKLR